MSISEFWEFNRVMWLRIFCIISLCILVIQAHARPLNIVSAEGFYGELAKEIGGDSVVVHSIITNPDADPHLFATSPSTSKELDNAQIIIYNGAGYDSWMEQLLQTVPVEHVSVINVAQLMQVKNNANPHIWYRLDTFAFLAKDLAAKIIALKPEAKAAVDKNLANFLADNQKISDKINLLRIKYIGTPVTATEPVFGYMADSLGFNMLGLDYQWKVMNDTEPSPKMLAQYEALFTEHKVRILFYNKQVVDSANKTILDIAKSNNIQIVGVTETIPVHLTINAWLMSELNLVERALLQVSK